MSKNEWTLETLKAYFDLEIAHLRELRGTDQEAIGLALQNNKERLDHLNENAKRTIEERSHFVSVESFTPFKEMVEKTFNQSLGKG